MWYTETKMCRTPYREEHLFDKEINTCYPWTFIPYKRRSLVLLIIAFNILIKIMLQQHKFYLSNKAQKWKSM